MRMDNRLIDFMFDAMKDCVKVGMEEEPNKFKYTRYVIMILNIFDMKLSKMDEVMFEKVLNELISYLR